MYTLRVYILINRSDFVDEKEFETNNENEKAIDNTEKLEDNDGWKFDA